MSATALATVEQKPYTCGQYCEMRMARKKKTPPLAHVRNGGAGTEKRPYVFDNNRILIRVHSFVDTKNILFEIPTLTPHWNVLFRCFSGCSTPRIIDENGNLPRGKESQDV